jgi:hypothetical protein
LGLQAGAWEHEQLTVLINVNRAVTRLLTLPGLLPRLLARPLTLTWPRQRHKFLRGLLLLLRRLYLRVLNGRDPDLVSHPGRMRRARGNHDLWGAEASEQEARGGQQQRSKRNTGCFQHYHPHAGRENRTDR